MNRPLDKDIKAWKGEGGATRAPLGVRALSMSGMAKRSSGPSASSSRSMMNSIAWCGHSDRLQVDRVMPHAQIPKRLSQFSRGGDIWSL